MTDDGRELTKDERLHLYHLAMNASPSLTWDEQQAMDEGWAIFSTCGVDDEGDLRIERLDEAGRFEDDKEAWTHVIRCAIHGSEYHALALNEIRADNPTEWGRLCEHARKMGVRLENLRQTSGD